jgi:hypothetical protein
METKNSSLLARLEAFSFNDPDSAFTFADRLSKENGWTPHYTTRALEEYKRFLFLAVEAGHPVSPSDAVDQAWHLHLTYTQSYWKELCGEVLKKSLHHHPTKGGAGESAKFAD